MTNERLRLWLAALFAAAACSACSGGGGGARDGAADVRLEVGGDKPVDAGGVGDASDAGPFDSGGPDVAFSDTGAADRDASEVDVPQGSDAQSDAVDQRADGEVVCPVFVPRDAGAAYATSGPTCSPSPLDIWTEELIILPSPHFGSVNLFTRKLFSLAPDDTWLASEKGMLHWDGVSWQDSFVNPDDVFGDGVDDGFYEVWAAGPGDMWVASAQGIRHWDGNALSAPVRAGKFRNLRGTAGNDVWAIVDYNLVAHWDGSTWTVQQPTPTATYVGTVWPAARDDVWAVANVPDVRMLHWDGQTWTTLSTCLPQQSTQISAPMWGSAPGDIWLSMRRALFHYDGKAWTQTERRFGGGDIWGSCANDVWLNDPNGFTVAHFDGVEWSHALNNLHAGQIHGSGPDDVWLNSPTGGGSLLYHRRVGTADAVCGNRRIDPGETCDYNEKCSATCQILPGCGNGVLEADEECDPPEPWFCSSKCKLVPTCGNGFYDPGEQCDPPNMAISAPGTVPTPWCDLNCQIPRCGNTVVDPGEDCDPPTRVPGLVPNESAFYCGTDCKRHDACQECHAICDTSPRPFDECRRLTCGSGPYLRCL